MSIRAKFYNTIARLNRRRIDNENRKRLKNHDFSLIASNCNGAFILHDLDIKFLSPTVNLFFFPDDFVRFLENLDFYLSQEMKFIKKKKLWVPYCKTKWYRNTLYAL